MPNPSDEGARCPFTNPQPCVQWRPVHLNPKDLVIFSPAKAAVLGDPDMPPTSFYLVSVLEDKDQSFDFEILESGSLAWCEALAISAAWKGQRVYLPNPPFKTGNDTQ